VIGGNTWLTHSVPAYSRVQAEPPALQVRQRDGVRSASTFDI
jgi:hypothetical protein